MAIETTGGMPPATAPTTEVIDGLNDLLQLDHDAIGSYEIAIERLDNRDQADQIAGFLRDHQRHVENLNALIQQLGGTPMNEPHATGPLKEALQKLGAAAGDKGILLSWRANELQVRTKYDGYASRANRWPAEVKRIVDENALDEERHYHWVAEVLAGMGIGSGEEMETDLVSRAREGVAQIGNATAGVRHRATSAVDAARSQVEEGMERAEQLRDNLEREVRTYPLRSVLAVFAVGFVIGRLLR